MQHPVEGSNRDIKGAAIEIAAFLSGDQQFGAVQRIALLVFQETGYHGTIRIFALGDILHLVAAVGALVSTLRTLNAQVVIRESIDGADFHIHNRLAGGSEDDLGIVIGVAAAKAGCQLGVGNGSCIVKVQEAKSQSDGVRAGVVDTAAQLALQRLPVPAADRPL